ncbi:uncharacterized protein LOC143875655 [Tasmannia lanceolata]|uniref:uncharacterized protein LOC143875655 n=1 Tax=Tasmannia lanceolata TaxID=3420 RepID=UPI004063EBD9
MEILNPKPPLPILLLLLLLLFKPSSSQPSYDFETRLRETAFQTLHRRKTGIIYNLTVPSPFLAQTMRLRSGSLRRRGAHFNEFSFPKGVSISGNPRSIFLVYRQITNQTLNITGYSLASLTFGIRLYNYSVTTNPVRFLAGGDPVTVTIPARDSSRIPADLWCVEFNITASFTSLPRAINSSSVVCDCTEAGDFSVMVRSELGNKGGDWKVILGWGLGGFFVLLVGVLVGFCGLRIVRRRRFRKMEKLYENGEMLQTWLIGATRAAGAAGTRTRPVLEKEERMLM